MKPDGPRKVGKFYSDHGEPTSIPIGRAHRKTLERAYRQQWLDELAEKRRASEKQERPE